MLRQAGNQCQLFNLLSSNPGLLSFMLGNKGAQVFDRQVKQSLAP